MLDEEAQLSPAVSTGPPQRPTQTARHAVDSMAARLGLSVVHRSGPGSVVDALQLPALLEDLTDPSATTSEGDGNRRLFAESCAQSTTFWYASCNFAAAGRRQKMPPTGWQSVT